MITKNPVIILEGPDCSGKTTLANQLMAQFKNCIYIHCSTSDDIESLHIAAITTAIEASNDFPVIIDRLHLSEEIYGKIFRNKVAYNTKLFEEKLSGCLNAYKVLCLIDKETTLKLHKERKNQEMFDNISKVWDEYSKVKTWKRYNWKTDKFNLEDYRC